jgi:hypothetical protein
MQQVELQQSGLEPARLGRQGDIGGLLGRRRGRRKNGGDAWFGGQVLGRGIVLLVSGKSRAVVRRGGRGCRG